MRSNTLSANPGQKKIMPMDPSGRVKVGTWIKAVNGVMTAVFAVTCLSGCSHGADARRADPARAYTPTDQGDSPSTPSSQTQKNCRAKRACSDRVRNFTLTEIEVIAHEVHGSFVEQIQLQPKMSTQLQAALVGALTVRAISKVDPLFRFDRENLNGGGFVILVQAFLQSSVASLSDQSLSLVELDQKLAEPSAESQNETNG